MNPANIKVLPAPQIEIEQGMAMKPDTVSLRELVIRKRFNHNDSARFITLLELTSEGFSWFGHPEGHHFWRKLCRNIKEKFPEAEDLILQNRPWQ